MMKRIVTLIMLGFFLSSAPVYSQMATSHLSFQYDISFGMGDLGDYISPASFRGASMQYRFPVNEKFFVGTDIGWNVFYEKKNSGSYTIGTATLTGVQSRYENLVPMLISADYIFLSKDKLRAYAGLGIGVVYSERALDMGTWRFSQDTWQFTLKPEVGLLYEVSMNMAIKLGVKYYYGVKTQNLDSQSYLTISTGIAKLF